MLTDKQKQILLKEAAEWGELTGSDPLGIFDLWASATGSQWDRRAKLLGVLSSDTHFRDEAMRFVEANLDSVATMIQHLKEAGQAVRRKQEQRELTRIAPKVRQAFQAAFTPRTRVAYQPRKYSDREVTAIKKALARSQHDIYLLEMDPAVVPIAKDLIEAGYKTRDYTCQGGSGSEFRNNAMIVLDASTIHTQDDLEHISQIIQRHTPITFKIVKNVGSQLLLPENYGLSATRIKSGSYVVWFDSPLEETHRNIYH